MFTEIGKKKIREFCLKYGRNAQNWDMKEAYRVFEYDIMNSGMPRAELRGFDTISRNPKVIYFEKEDFLPEYLEERGEE